MGLPASSGFQPMARPSSMMVSTISGLNIRGHWAMICWPSGDSLSSIRTSVKRSVLRFAQRY